jgi:hypothetical protein
MKTREIIGTKKITEEISQKHINQTFWISSRTIFCLSQLEDFLSYLLKNVKFS